jgi:hypothetical protein
MDRLVSYEAACAGGTRSKDSMFTHTQLFPWKSNFKNMSRLGMAAQAYNSGYLGGRNQEARGSRLSLGKKFTRPYLNQ